MLAGLLIGGLWLVFIMLAVWIWRDGRHHITTLRRAALRKRKAGPLRILIHGIPLGEKRSISTFFWLPLGISASRTLQKSGR